MSEPRSEKIGQDAPRVEQPSNIEPIPLDPGEAVEALREWAKDNPHMAVAGAAAVGFLLGGGLTPRMLGAIGMVAARHYLKRTAEEVIDKLVPEQVAEVLGKVSRY